jgi:hypothetical protein
MSKKNTATSDKPTTLQPVQDLAAVVTAAASHDALSPQDKTELDNVKARHTVAKEKMELAALHLQNAELTYNNVILRIAMKHGLVDGDLINEDGSITRRSR